MRKPPSPKPQIFDPNTSVDDNQPSEVLDTDRCPLCSGGNSCLPSSLGITGADIPESACWCADPALKFPKALLQKVPKQLRHKACICRQCVESYWRENS